MENLSVLFGTALSADDDASTRTVACHALCACMAIPFLVASMGIQITQGLTTRQVAPGLLTPKPKPFCWIFSEGQKPNMDGPGHFSCRN